MIGINEEAFKKLRLSGNILRETREEIEKIVYEDMPIIEVCEITEKLIRKKGGKPAFPCNVSINETAAHYTSPPNDKKRIPKKSIVKVDIGVHVDGYVTDTATSISFNPEYKNLIETAKEALNVAIKNIQPGISTSKLGGIIEKTIKKNGYKPISNLTGHQIGRYLIHTGISVPNVSQHSFFSSKIELGRIYAIEPFVTFSNATGRVENGDERTIFRFVKNKSLKNPFAKQLLKYIKKKFRTLPFSERWLQTVVPKENYSDAFQELLSSKTLISYPTFIEASRNPVAQAEHTVLIIKDGCLVLT
jgi:methionyl aminopeptidase